MFKSERAMTPTGAAERARPAPQGRCPDRRRRGLSALSLHHWSLAAVALMLLTCLLPVQAANPLFAPELDGPVWVIRDDPHHARTLVGGEFSTFDGHRSPLLVALDGEGVIDPEFVPALADDGGRIRAIAVQDDGRILIAGWFTPIAEGEPRPATAVARLWPDGSLDQDFQLRQFDGPAQAVARMEGEMVLLGGQFSHVDNEPRGGIVRLHDNGDIDESFQFQFQGGDEQVEAIVTTPDGMVLIAGAFSAPGDHDGAHLVRLQPHGELDLDFIIQPDGPVLAVAASEHDHRPLIGGHFHHINGESYRLLARLEDNGQPDSSFDLPDGIEGEQVSALTHDAKGRLLVGGDFSAIGGHPATFLARLGGDGEIDSRFAPLIDGPVHAIGVRPDGSILIAGEFTQVNGLPRTGLALLEDDGQTVGPPPAPPGLLLPPRHDSGQTQCWDNHGGEIPCNRPTHPSQDGHNGRDRAALDGLLTKTGGGAGGFDFSKIANDGSLLPPASALGPDPDDWACTVDHVTGLIWEIKLNNPAWYEHGNPRHYSWGFSWFDDDDSHNGGDAGIQPGPGLGCGFTISCDTRTFLEYLNDIQLCGRTDWRLPSLVELQNVTHLGASFHTGGALDPVYFADAGGYRGHGGATWTSDTDVDHDGHHAWAINFDDGHAEGHPKGGLATIRAVSGTVHELSGPDPVCGKHENSQIRPSSAGAFTLQGQLAHDARTGLVWDRCSIGQTFQHGGDGQHCDGFGQAMDWQQAQQQVKALNAAGHLGHDDWRLPNLKELASLHERRCAMPSVDARVFPHVDPEPHWTSTTSHLVPDSAFVMTFEFGHQITMQKHQPFGRVRPVRGGGPFDDYSGEPAWEIAGQLSGLIGAGLQLQLLADGGIDEALTIDSNGRFAFQAGLADGAGYEVGLLQPPYPGQECTISNGSGTITGADIDTVAVDCAAPEPAVISLDTDQFAFTLLQGQQDQAGLTISNLGGGFLDWTIATTYSGASTGAGNAPDRPSAVQVVTGGSSCESGSQMLINDDGTAESAYGGNVNWSGGVALVDRFMPTAYPSSIQSVCLGLAGTGGADSMALQVVVHDDNGPGGGPGTELASLAVLATGLPAYPVAVPQWFQVDLSGLYTTVESGSLYVGLRWQPSTPQVFVLSDESTDRPVGHAGGHYWNHGVAPGEWTPIQSVFPNYRSAMIRAEQGGEQQPPTGCDVPSNVPWLSLDKVSGSTPEGATDPVQLQVNADGIPAGEHSALLCIDSNDSGQPRVEVPVTLTLIDAPGELTVSPAQLDFGAVAIGSDSDELTVTLSVDASGPALDLVIDPVDGPFQRLGGDCPQAVFSLTAGQSCTASYGYQPVQVMLNEQTLAVTGPFNNTTFTLHGAGQPSAPVSLVALSGNNQQTLVDTPFPHPLTVLVQDAFGHPVPGVPVVFMTPSTGPGAQVLPVTVATDGQGYVSVQAIANDQAGSYHVMARVADSAVAASFVLHNLAPEPDVGIRLVGSRQHAKPGQRVDYVITVDNNGPDHAHGVQLVSALSDQFDMAATHWQCLGPASSGCTAAGIGNLIDDGLNLPSGGQITWLLATVVRSDAVDDVADSQVLVEAANDGNPDNDSASDQVTLVIHRDGFERYGDGAGAQDSQLSWTLPSRLQWLPEAGSETRGRVRRLLEAGADDGSGFAIDGYLDGDRHWLRLESWPAGAERRAGTWRAVPAGQALQIGVLADDACQTTACAQVQLRLDDLLLLSAALSGSRFQVVVHGGSTQAVAN